MPGAWGGCAHPSGSHCTWSKSQNTLRTLPPLLPPAPHSLCAATLVTSLCLNTLDTSPPQGLWAGCSLRLEHSPIYTSVTAPSPVQDPVCPQGRVPSPTTRCLGLRPPQPHIPKAHPTPSDSTTKFKGRSLTKEFLRHSTEPLCPTNDYIPRTSLWG